MLYDGGRVLVAGGGTGNFGSGYAGVSGRDRLDAVTTAELRK